MKLPETILIAITICLMIIGVHQSMMHGFANSYWIFMLMMCFLIAYQFRKNKRTEKEQANDQPAERNTSQVLPRSKRKRVR